MPPTFLRMASPMGYIILAVYLTGSTPDATALFVYKDIWKERKDPKKVFAVGLSLTLAVTLGFGGCRFSLAEESTGVYHSEELSLSDYITEDSQELFQNYVNQMFSVKKSNTVRKVPRKKKLTGNNAVIYSYIADAVAGILKVLLDGTTGEAYNISADYDGMTLGQYAEYIASLSNNKVVYDISNNPNASQAQNALLDNSKIKKIGYKPHYSVCEALKRTYTIYKNNKVQVRVKNMGTTAGTETVQVYIRHLADKEGPKKSLRAYQQVTLNAAEAKTISIELPRKSFEGWDVKTNTMRVVPGKYEVMVGNSSADKDLKKIIVNIK